MNPPNTQVLTSAWQLGIQLGLSLFDTRKYEAAIRSAEPQLPAGNEKLPRPLIALVGQGAMHQVASVEHYERCAQAAQAMGIQLTPLPEEQRKCSLLIYQAPKLTSDRIRELPQLEKAYLEILAKASSLIRASFAASTSEALPLFEMAALASDQATEQSPAQFERNARASGIPEAIWIPFFNLLSGKAEESMLREALNQLDKEVQRYLVHEKGSAGTR